MIGLYGGTFNPIHVGHLRAARDVAEALDLERVVFIPNANPPHKSDDGDDRGAATRIAPAEDRLRWVDAALEDQPLFESSRVEIDREGPSWLIETLRELTAGEASSFVFIVGQDAFAEMGSWRAPRDLVMCCNWVVTTRPPVVEGSLADWMPEGLKADFDFDSSGRLATHRTASTWIRLLEITPVDVSASKLRVDIAQGRDTQLWLPDGIRDAVLASGCYTDEPPCVRPAHPPRPVRGEETPQ